MPEQDTPIVINDRRRFRGGDPAEDRPVTETAASAEPAPEPAAEATPHTNSAHLITPVPEPVNAHMADDLSDPESDLDAATAEDLEAEAAAALPPPPTPEEIEQVRAAYEQTADRLDTMMRSQNLGAEHLPPMNFQRLVQSIYMSAMIQLGAGTQQGQQARVDLIGAKQSIEMLAVVANKAVGNLSGEEEQILESALFELRMGFLEITQLLARQAAAKQQQTAPPGQTGAGGFGGGGFTGAGPRIVR